MSTIHALKHVTMDDASPLQPGEQGYVVCVKGAAGGLLERSTHMLHRKGALPIEEHDIQEIREASSRMANQALRVLGVAYRKLDRLPEKPTADEIERDLIFVGLIGMIDPARPEVKPAIEEARQAGIRTVMITGDHPDTARAIASQIGLLRADAEVHAGVELDQMSDDELNQMVAKTDVFARVSPAHKVRIVEAFRARDEIVAMTGDGVNDAPALEARRHRRGDGHHRHRREQGNGGHGADRRQLRLHRERGGTGPHHLQQHPQVCVLSVVVQRRGDCHHLHRGAGRLDHTADTDPTAVAQLVDRWRARVSAGY